MLFTTKMDAKQKMVKIGKTTPGYALYLSNASMHLPKTHDGLPAHAMLFVDYKNLANAGKVLLCTLSHNEPTRFLDIKFTEEDDIVFSIECANVPGMSVHLIGYIDEDSDESSTECSATSFSRSPASSPSSM